MKQHIVITGGAGFIGSNLYKKLRNKGFKITLVEYDDWSFNEKTLIKANNILSLTSGDQMMSKGARG